MILETNKKVGQKTSYMKRLPLNTCIAGALGRTHRRMEASPCLGSQRDVDWWYARLRNIINRLGLSNARPDNALRVGTKHTAGSVRPKVRMKGVRVPWRAYSHDATF